MEALCGRGEVYSIWKEEKKDGQQNERKERRKNREGTALRSLKQLMLTLRKRAYDGVFILFPLS